MINVIHVILCGGSGIRLRQLLSTGFLEQLLCLTSKESVFPQAALRLANLGKAEIQVASPTIVTGKDHRFLISEQLREIGIELGCALPEPMGKNTETALTLAALSAMEGGSDPDLVVTPAYQTLLNTNAVNAAMQCAVAEAATGTIVILGVTSDKPEMGYEYIQINQCESNAGVSIVRCFVEKPDANTAQAYLYEAGYYWNAGMFVFKASFGFKALVQFRTDILQATQVAWSKRSADNAFVPLGSNFPIKMGSLDAGWNDPEACEAVCNVLLKDEAGNADLGDVLTTDSRNTLVHATSRLASLVGVENLTVVETPDAVLVANKTRSHGVKHIVTQLQKTKREEHTLHRKVHRPRGWYDNINKGGRFKVKRMQAKRKASLSLQKDHHRAEHWVMMTGTAGIIKGDKVLTLTENQSTYIPLGEVHRLANPGTIPLEIIEVQSRRYLGEDDIVRFEYKNGHK